jgi:acyl-CoA thioester hydrolase
MITSRLNFRVRYNEVDQMGYVHHGNYAAFFEMGRTELMRTYDLTYKNLEDSGIILPLSEYSVKFFEPALYDDELHLETRLVKCEGVRLIFEYTLYKEQNKKIAEGVTPLVFVSSETRKPMRPPVHFLEKIKPFFS